MTWVRKCTYGEDFKNYKLSGKCDPPPEVVELFHKYNSLNSTCDWYLFTDRAKKLYSIWPDLDDYNAVVYYKKPNYTIKSVGKVV